PSFTQERQHNTTSHSGNYTTVDFFIRGKEEIKTLVEISAQSLALIHCKTSSTHFRVKRISTYANDTRQIIIGYTIIRFLTHQIRIHTVHLLNLSYRHIVLLLYCRFANLSRRTAKKN